MRKVLALWVSNMVSEDLEKIIALIIVALSFISIPVVLFFFVVMIYFNVNQIIQFSYTRNLADASLAIAMAIINAVLFFAIRALIRWVRK
jgi:hypothetical protein